MWKLVLKWTGNVVIALFAVVIVMSIYSIVQSKRNPGHIPSVLGIRTMSVLSGSMQPVLYPGDMVVVRETDPQSIKVGSVITYRKGGNVLVTHRVVEVLNKDGSLTFRTKGDANNVEDTSSVTPDSIIGAMVFRVPYGGYVASFARSPVGFVIFIMVPVILLLGGEIKTIANSSAEAKREELKKKVIGK